MSGRRELLSPGSVTAGVGEMDSGEGAAERWIKLAAGFSTLYVAYIQDLLALIISTVTSGKVVKSSLLESMHWDCGWRLLALLHI